ncbi:MAG: ABC transporter substrate-binding protein [Rhizobiales bacterium]|nr:ABC transporter substrate-binding protein [Hyphomicrobiales bacterium]
MRARGARAWTGGQAFGGTRGLRRAIVATLLAITAPFAGDGALAGERMHAIAMHGGPRHGPDFTHFSYVDPQAPKGGMLTLGVLGSFDSLNPHILKGDAAIGIRGYVYESLLERALDEPFTLYAHLAESVEVPDDRSSITFHMDPAARFSDGEPVTVEDVIFSHALLRDKGRHNHRTYYRKVSKVERVGERGVRFSFDADGDREMALIMGLMPILPKHATDPATFEQTSLTIPVGSGPYLVDGIVTGDRIDYRRDPDYWAKDRPSQRGRHNFERIRYDYYRDTNAMLEAFKKGLIDVRGEGDPGQWAEAYTGPAFDDGRIVKRAFPIGLPAGMNAIVFNTRRKPLDDIRVRKALTLLFDFEWLNKNLYHGLYARTQSYFERSDLSAHGRPADARERAWLAPFVGEIDADVLEGRHNLPATDGSGRNRDNQRMALALLAEAGYRIEGGKLVGADGRQLTFEILAVTKEQERLFLALARGLGPLGIELQIRQVDSAIFQQRKKTYYYDMIQNAWGASLSPGNEQLYRWSSESAASEATFNFAGVKSPAVDAMIAQLLAAHDREAFVSAARALDRALISGNYVLPLFHLQEQWVAHAARLEAPRTTSLWGYQIDTWWQK